MELTRRDALAALSVAGVAVGLGAATSEQSGRAPDGSDATENAGTSEADLGPHERETLLDVARVVYPSVVTGLETFVGTYLDGRVATRPEYVDGAHEAIETLDGMGESWHGGRFVALDPETQNRLLRETGADTADPDPEGSPAERIRYYLVNELLFALYSSPTGGELLGIESPQGHPGGLESYQRGAKQ